MIVLDENFTESQRQLLRGWRISVRQIGYDIGRSGMDDDEIIPFLLRLRRPTFFTLDRGFYKRELVSLFLLTLHALEKLFRVLK